MRALYAVVVVAIVAGCASIRPVPMQVGDRCFNCTRIIGNLHVAAELFDQLKTPRPFRSAGCLAKYLKAHPNQPVAAVFVTDYRTGRMLPADDAWFVPTSLKQPDGKATDADYLAFRSRGDATAESGERPVLLRWVQVVAESSAR